MDAAIICWFVVATAALIFLSTGCYLLISEKSKTAIDYLLLHLCFVDLVTLLWNGISKFRFIFVGVDHSMQDYYIVGVVSLVVGQIISIIFLTVDRVLAVKLTIKYKACVTKRRILFLLLFCWIICFLHGFITYFFLISIYNLVLSIWAIVAVMIIFFGYGYIILVVQYRNRELTVNSQQVRRPIVKLTVPAAIVTTFVLLALIPEMILAAGVSYSTWFLCFFHANYMSDSILGQVVLKNELRDGLGELHRSIIVRYHMLLVEFDLAMPCECSSSSRSTCTLTFGN